MTAGLQARDGFDYNGILYVQNSPFNVTYTIGTEAANIINVSMQLIDGANNLVAARGNVRCYLSDDANGDSIAATAPTGGIAIGTDGVLMPVEANKSFWLTSEATGIADVDITDTGTPTFYLIMIDPMGKLHPSAAITFA